MVAKKKSTTRRKPRAAARKKSTAAPKRIINRKKTVRKSAAPKVDREKAAKKKLEQDSRDTAKVERLTAKGKTPKEIAELTGMPIGRVRKLLRTASMNPADKIVGTESQVAKQIVKLRGEGVSWPTIRARTGMSGRKIRELAEAAGGSSSGRPAKKAASTKTAAAKPGRKSGAARKAAASKAKPKAAARSKRTAKKAAAKEDAAPTGRPQGARARRAALMKFLKDVVWDLDTDNDEVADGIVGHTIEVTREFNGRAIRPTEHQVMAVNDVTVHDTHGRLIEFVDENHQVRFVSSREITSMK